MSHFLEPVGRKQFQRSKFEEILYREYGTGQSQ